MLYREDFPPRTYGIDGAIPWHINDYRLYVWNRDEDCTVRLIVITEKDFPLYDVYRTPPTHGCLFPLRRNLLSVVQVIKSKHV
jgi:hypothetical protein